jgi:hypothetical protein
MVLVQLTALQYQTVRHPVHLNNPEIDAAAQEEQCESRHRLASANECGLSDMITEPMLCKRFADQVSDLETNLLTSFYWILGPQSPA